MPIVARSFLLFALFFVVIAGEYAVANAFGHSIAYRMQPDIVPRPELMEHPVLRMMLVIVPLAATFMLMMGNPSSRWRLRLFDLERQGVYRASLAFAAILSLIILFAYVGLPDHTVYGVITLDIVLLVGIIARIGWWLTDGRTTSLSETS